MKPPPVLQWHIFHILSSEDINDFTDRVPVANGLLQSCFYNVYEGVSES